MQPIRNSGLISWPALTAAAPATNWWWTAWYMASLGRSSCEKRIPEQVQPNRSRPVLLWLLISLKVIQYRTLCLYRSITVDA